ncbi:MAG: hypothetical protein AAB316_24715, partial [Bacteroidota bacterium]
MTIAMPPTRSLRKTLPLRATIDGQPVKKGNRLPAANFGERWATDFFAAAGHRILFSKPDLKGTNQPGFDLVTMKNSRVYFIDNKAFMRNGKVYGVSALTRNFPANLARFKSTLLRLAQLPRLPASYKQVLTAALASLQKGNYRRVVTNANFGTLGLHLTGISDA